MSARSREAWQNLGIVLAIITAIAVFPALVDVVSHHARWVAYLLGGVGLCLFVAVLPDLIGPRKD